MVGPWLPDPNLPGKKRRAHLFCFLDDHSRLVPYAEFFFDEALPRLERVLKVALLRRGVPLTVYVDNGQVYSSLQFNAACATLGIGRCTQRRIQTAPYSPEAKGKQERFFETLRAQFLPDAFGGNLEHHDLDRSQRIAVGLARVRVPSARPSAAKRNKPR